MEACAAVEKELEKVKNKFGSLKKNLDLSIEDQIAAIDRLQRELLENNEEANSNTISILSLHCRIKRSQPSYLPKSSFDTFWYFKSSGFVLIFIQVLLLLLSVHLC